MVETKAENTVDLENRTGQDDADSSDMESDSEITQALEKIGVTLPSFMIPNIEMLNPSSVSKKINDYLGQSVSMEKVSSSNLKEMLTELINKRTCDLKSLYTEVADSLTDIVDVNINHPVDDFLDNAQECPGNSGYDGNNNKDDGSDNNNPNTDSDISTLGHINERTGNKNVGTVRTQLSNNTEVPNGGSDGVGDLDVYEHLTHLTFDQFQDQKFLRRRIREILNLKIQPLLQRILIQKLMSRSYIEKQNHIKLQLAQELKVKNKGQIQKLDQFNSTDIEDDKQNHRHSNDGGAGDENYTEKEACEEEEDDNNIEDDEVFFTDEDRTASYYSLEDDILGCKHYQRNCKIECTVCHKWYVCRFCHDAENPSHQLERKKVQHVMCMFCFTPQYPEQYCVECNKELSKYFCSKCKLFDNDPMKNIYHCDKCGMCRLGLGLNQDYFHCDSCNACISIDLKKNHVCIENATKSNCPICDEFMFSSKETVVFMNCGHPIHENCYREHTLHSYKCPTCSKTISNMELQFRMRDAEISNSKMPDELKDWISEIKCVDCGGMSRVPFHYLGHKCDHCHSYNTMKLKTIKNNEETQNINTDEASTDEKLYAAEQFITDSLNQNFEFEYAKERLKESEKENESIHITEQDMSIDHDYVDNFRKVINNFEAYSSLSDAFKDWINSSLDNNVGEDRD